MESTLALPRSRRLLPALLPFLLLAAACQSSQTAPPSAPPPAQGQKAHVANTFEASAQVVSVDAASRRVSLRREDGTVIDLQLGEQVRNFAQIAVGDVVRVSYEETLAAAKLPAGTDIRTAEGAFAAGRAKAGAKPGAGVGAGISIRVRVESIDLPRDIVVFALGSGELMARRLRTQEGRAFATGLKVGDLVQLDYTECVAVEVQEL
jgi:hypothetical protein